MDETRCTLPYGTDTDIYNITHSSTKSNPRSIWRGNRIRLAFHLVVRYNNAIKYPLTVSTVISSRVSKRLKADLPLGAFLYIIRAFGPQDGTLKGVPFFRFRGGE